MSAIKPLCFYYPTTVVIVDDNKTFLENLPENLSQASTYKLFDSPVEALKFLDKKREDLPSPDDFLGLTDDLATGVSLNINIPKIRTCLHDKNRLNTPTIVIVDHDMPGMLGLEFCRTLGDYPIKKIMLTGAADHKLAVQAFNDGNIHRFIAKDDPNVFEAIDQAVRELQQECFWHLSEHIFKTITATTFSFLGNKVFHHFFNMFMKENNVVEFYLIDAMGSFLLLNHKGEQARLVVQSDQEIENYCQAARDHQAPEEIIIALASKEKLLCLFSEEDFNLPVEAWGDYLHKANKVEGMSGCYYAIVKHKK